MKSVSYNSVWEYFFSASTSKSEKVLHDLPHALKIGMQDDDTHHLCSISVFRRGIREYGDYVSACKKYEFNPVEESEFERLSDIFSRALMSSDGKSYILDMVNKRYFESDLGKMNEALK